MSAHTPGPWHATTTPGDSRRLVADLVEAPGLTHYRIVHEGIDEGDGAADAALIAAAPDLLTALKEALLYVEVCHERGLVPNVDGDGFAQARAAVVKAEGRA